MSGPAHLRVEDDIPQHQHTFWTSRIYYALNEGINNKHRSLGKKEFIGTVEVPLSTELHLQFTNLYWLTVFPILLVTSFLVIAA